MTNNNIPNNYDHSTEFNNTSDLDKLNLVHLRTMYKYYLNNPKISKPDKTINDSKIEAILAVIQDNNENVKRVLHNHKHP